MTKSILMPQVGQDLTEGRVIAINVKVGDFVKKGDIVAEVESEKATFEVEAFEEGTVTEVCFGEMRWQSFLSLLSFWTVLPTMRLPLRKASSTDNKASAEGKAPATNQSDSPRVSLSTKPRSTPLARRIMKQHGIDIGTLTGSGPGGAIVQRDVEAAIAIKGVGQRLRPTLNRHRLKRLSELRCVKVTL